MEDLTVNDGKGMLDNIGLIDSLIVDCNDLPKAIMAGQYVQFCNLIVQMVKKLANLRDGVKNDTQSLMEQLKDTQRINEELCKALKEVSKDVEH